MRSRRAPREPRALRWRVVAVALAGAVLVVAAVVIVIVGSSSGGDSRAAPAARVADGSKSIRTTTAFDARGDTIELDEGWYLADVPMAPELVNPRELLSLATFPLDVPPARPVCVGNAPPASPVAVMGPEDVYVWLVEWFPTGSRMPSVETSARRPETFDVDRTHRGCVGAAFPEVRGGSISFTDRGRVFNLYVVVGVGVSDDRVRVVEEMLDSLAFAD